MDSEFSPKQAKMLLAGGLALICLLIIGVVYLVKRSASEADKNADAASSTTVSETKEVVEDLLSSEPYQVVDTYEDFRFESPKGIFWYPISTEHGPSEFSESRSAGFTKSQEGAALAAIHLLFRLSESKESFVETFNSQTTGLELELSMEDELSLMFIKSPDLYQKMVPVGWISSFTLEDEAFVVPCFLERSPEEITCYEVGLVWEDSDWKLFANENAGWFDNPIQPTERPDVYFGGVFL